MTGTYMVTTAHEWYRSGMDNSPDDRQPMHLRLPADLHGAVKEYAARTHRSVNSAAVHLVALGLERETTPAPEQAR